jgi:hypothetical protein
MIGTTVGVALIVNRAGVAVGDVLAGPVPAAAVAMPAGR